MRARPRPPAHAGDMNGFPSQTCPSVPPLRMPLEINTIAMGHLHGTLGFRDTSKWSEGVGFISGGWIEESFAADRPRPGSAVGARSRLGNPGLELAQTVTDLVRGGICRDVLVARSRVESAALVRPWVPRSSAMRDAPTFSSAMRSRSVRREQKTGLRDVGTLWEFFHSAMCTAVKSFSFLFF
jgi:hypothetical protein